MEPTNNEMLAQEIKKYEERKADERRGNVLATAYMVLLNTILMFLIGGYIALSMDVRDLQKVLNDISVTNAENQISKNARVESTEKQLKELWAAIDETDISLDKVATVEYDDEAPVLSNTEMVPTCSTNTFRCMDYRTLTNHASEQWKLQMECYSDAVTGIRVYQKNGIRYFCAALGSAYGQNIGDAFNFTLENGTSFNVIYADFKNPLGSTDMFFGHPDTNYDGELGIGLLEFVYDKDIAPQKVIQAGTMTALDIFGGLRGDGGNIAKIVYLGKVWNNDSSI